jgi:hypothetical protein
MTKSLFFVSGNLIRLFFWILLSKSLCEEPDDINLLGFRSYFCKKKLIIKESRFFHNSAIVSDAHAVSFEKARVDVFVSFERIFALFYLL